jgi:hypothetical protein
MLHLSGNWILLCMSLCEKVRVEATRFTSVRLEQFISQKADTLHKVPACTGHSCFSTGISVFTSVAAQMCVTGFCVAVRCCAGGGTVMGPLEHLTTMGRGWVLGGGWTDRCLNGWTETNK